MNINVGNESQLDLVLGTMCSSKTTHTLVNACKLAEINYKIAYINSKKDNRSNLSFSCHNPLFKTEKDFENGGPIIKNLEMVKTKKLMSVDINEKDVIIIDESHFFDDLVEFVEKCLDENKYVIVIGLIADTKGNKFGNILDLVPMCTNIERLHAYCSECAKNKIRKVAIYSKCIVESDNVVNVGGTEKYIPVCRKHYKQNNSKIIKIKDNEEQTKVPDKNKQENIIIAK